MRRYGRMPLVVVSRLEMRRVARRIATKQWIQRDRKENPAKYALRKNQRRDSVSHGVVTVAEWELILEMFDYRCAWCHQSVSELTQDHVTPLSKGGPHSMNNVVPACRNCNSRKGVRSWSLHGYSQ